MMQLLCIARGCGRRAHLTQFPADQVQCFSCFRFRMTVHKSCDAIAEPRNNVRRAHQLHVEDLGSPLESENDTGADGVISTDLPTNTKGPTTISDTIARI